MSSRGEYRRDERERGRGERTRERHSRSERHRDEPRRRRSSRSHSPRDRRGPDRRDYRRDRDRDRDRDSERYRERAREREQGGRKREEKKEEKPAVQTDEPEEGEEMEAANEDTEAMMTAMGMAAFASTKGKHVTGNQEGAANVKKSRTWRQYMNRRGGFNRPLDKIR